MPTKADTLKIAVADARLGLSYVESAEHVYRNPRPFTKYGAEVHRALRYFERVVKNLERLDRTPKRSTTTVRASRTKKSKAAA